MEEAPLPPTAQVVAEIIGREPTLALARTAKYRAMYVPYQIRDNHWIAKTVGRRHADALSRHLGGLHLPLARCESVVTAERNAAIRLAFRAGKTIEWLAVQHTLSARMVELILDPKRAAAVRATQRERAARMRNTPGYQRPDRQTSGGGQK
jgi:hypothetical protein